MKLKVQRQVYWGGINRLFIWRPKNYVYYFYTIPQRWRSKFCFGLENLLFWVSFSLFYWRISSEIAHVWRTHQTMHARTFTRTIPWSFAPPSHLNFRTHACDARTHTRTLILCKWKHIFLFWYKFQTFSFKSWIKLIKFMILDKKEIQPKSLHCNLQINFKRQKR